MIETLTKTAAFVRIEALVFQGVQWIHIALDAAGAAIIALGALIVLAQLVSRFVHGDTSRLTGVRLVLARFLTLALEFQLAADVLATAIAPDWSDIGQLAAIGFIRTALNYSLTREIAGERREIADDEVRKSNTSRTTA